MDEFICKRNEENFILKTIGCQLSKIVKMFLWFFKLWK